MEFPDFTLSDYGDPEPQKEEIGLIRGKVPDSVEEWRVAQALIQLEIDFLYQIPVRGGTSVRGGQVLDFLLFLPWEVPAQVFGEYWHKGELDSEERFKLAILEETYQVDVIIWWGQELETQEEALIAVKKETGR